MHQQHDLVAYHRELIALDHNYAKPFVNQDVNDKTKLLFLEPFVRSQNSQPINPYEWVDVENTQCSPDDNYNTINTFDINSEEDQILISLFGTDKIDVDSSDNDEEILEVDDRDDTQHKSTYSEIENKLSKLKVDTTMFRSIYSALEKYETRRVLSLKDPVSKMSKTANVINQLHFEAVAKKIRFFYASAQWKMNVCACLHACLLELLPKALLSLYINALRSLFTRGKITSLIDELNQGASITQYVKRFSVDQVIKLIKNDEVTKTKFDVDFTWPVGLPRPVAVCLTFPMVSKSRRLSRFLQVINNFCQVITPKSDTENGDSAPSLKVRLHQLKRKLLHEINNGNHVFLIGWGTASLLAMIASLQLNRHEQTQSGKESNIHGSSLLGVICLGLAVRGLRGNRGGIDDPLLSLRTPALWVTGENSLSGPPEEAEVMRERMKHTEISLVRVGGCDHLLRMSRRWKMGHRVTQEHVDARIAKEIMEFMSERVKLSQANKSEAESLSTPNPAVSSASMPVVTKPSTSSFSDLMERCGSIYSFTASSSKKSNYPYAGGTPPVRGGSGIKRFHQQSYNQTSNLLAAGSSTGKSPSFNQRSSTPARMPPNSSQQLLCPDPYPSRSHHQPAARKMTSNHRPGGYHPYTNQSRANQKHRARIIGPGGRFTDQESQAMRIRGSPMTNRSFTSYTQNDSTNWSVKCDDSSERFNQKSFSERMSLYPPSPSRAARFHGGRGANNLSRRATYSEERMNMFSSPANQISTNQPSIVVSSNQESELEQAISSII